MMTATSWLREHYCKKKANNKHYSLRAYARDLSVAPGALSEILAGVRPLTPKQGKKIALSLVFGERERQEFLALLSESRTANELMRAGANGDDFHRLEDDELLTICEPYHFYILSLMKTTDFRSDLKWIATRLGVTTTEARAAIDRLARLKLIREVDGEFVRTKRQVGTTTQIPSKALRSSHKISLQEIIDGLDDIPIEERDLSSMTLAIDPTKIPEAKQIIKDFRRGLAALLEDGTPREVYNLNIQLMPVTKPNMEGKNEI